MVELPCGVGIALDLDDTLYSERSYHDSGFRWIAERAGLDPGDAALAQASMALRAGGDPLAILSAATGVPVRTLLAWHRTHPPRIALYSDAARFLQRAAASEIPLILLSDGRSGTQRRKIDALGIGGAFRAILISGETGVGKSDVAAYEQAAALLPEAALHAYFGDNPTKDVSGPLGLGWSTFLIGDRGDNVHPQVAESGGVMTLRSFDEVVLPAAPTRRSHG